MIANIDDWLLPCIDGCGAKIFFDGPGGGYGLGTVSGAGFFGDGCGYGTTLVIDGQDYGRGYGVGAGNGEGGDY